LLSDRISEFELLGLLPAGFFRGPVSLQFGGQLRSGGWTDCFLLSAEQ
jgi:hypothetical protein